jgi:hypothetical protein
MIFIRTVSFYVLSDTFGANRNEVTGDWRELHKWAGHGAHMEKKRNAFSRGGGT